MSPTKKNETTTADSNNENNTTVNTGDKRKREEDIAAGLLTMKASTITEPVEFAMKKTKGGKLSKKKQDEEKEREKALILQRMEEPCMVKFSEFAGFWKKVSSTRIEKVKYPTSTAMLYWRHFDHMASAEAIDNYDPLKLKLPRLFEVPFTKMPMDPIPANGIKANAYRNKMDREMFVRSLCLRIARWRINYTIGYDIHDVAEEDLNAVNSLIRMTFTHDQDIVLPFTKSEFITWVYHVNPLTDEIVELFYKNRMQEYQRETWIVVRLLLPEEILEENPFRISKDNQMLMKELRKQVIEKDNWSSNEQPSFTRLLKAVEQIISKDNKEAKQGKGSKSSMGIAKDIGKKAAVYSTIPNKKAKITEEVVPPAVEIIGSRSRTTRRNLI